MREMRRNFETDKAVLTLGSLINRAKHVRRHADILDRYGFKQRFFGLLAVGAQ